ncbi:MAG TPA: hypothetical protein VFN13_06285 [Rudaea sp.]|nr:hypothetical protein [Rudaea sp.]
MKLPTNELLLALRSPTSGWLATMICALDEALQDPDFTDHQRELVRQMLDCNGIPSTVASAAEARMVHFEQAVADEQEHLFNRVADAQSAPKKQRPKLTLVGSAAA